MSKKYYFSFMFYETKTLIPLEYASFEEALADAKFYAHVFIFAAWDKVTSNGEFNAVYNAFSKLVGEFKLEPNETNFNFHEYFETCYKFYEFKKDMEATWLGMVS